MPYRFQNFLNWMKNKLNKRCKNLTPAYADNQMVHSEFGIAVSSYVNLNEDDIQTASREKTNRLSVGIF